MFGILPLDVASLIRLPPTGDECVNHVCFLVELLRPRLLVIYDLIINIDVEVDVIHVRGSSKLHEHI